MDPKIVSSVDPKIVSSVDPQIVSNVDPKIVRARKRQQQAFANERICKQCREFWQHSLTVGTTTTSENHKF